MGYKAITAVWELTMGCNMRCKHCGSSCENAANDELTTEEALSLCDDLGKLGLDYITMSGGEPTTRKDWNIIANRLRQNNIKTTMISNGWLMSQELINKAIEAGINTIAISIDGLKETHDMMRREGSFDRDMNALELMKNSKLPASVVTTINKKNLVELEKMKELFINKGVRSWQLQFGLPMGNLHNNSELVIEPEDVDKIIDFAYTNRNNGKIIISLADCMGYYNNKEIEVRKCSSGSSGVWNGCNAGKRSFGILCNGDILGCTSIRNREFIEGNIKEKSITDIWEDPDSFRWSREMKKSKLKGLCSKCGYGDICLGGCANSRLCMENSIYSENKYCSYNIIIEKKKEQIESIDDINILYEIAFNLSNSKQYQISELLLDRALRLCKDNEKILSLYGFVNYMLNNYEKSKDINERLIELNYNNIYAHKGLGLNLCKLGHAEEGIKCLEKALELSDKKDMEIYHDLIVTLAEVGRKDRAKELLEIVENNSKDFFKKNEEVYKCI